MAVNSTLGSSLSISTFDDFSRMSFEECAKSIHKIIRISLREYARAIEIFREIENKEMDELTRSKAASFRRIFPMTPSYGSAAFSTLSLFATILNFEKKNTEIFTFGDSISKAVQNIMNNYENADRTEIDGQIERSKELRDRRTKEANDRRSDSEEFSNLMQQMNREIAEAIRAIARG